MKSVFLRANIGGCVEEFLVLVLEGFGFNEVLKRHSKIDFWVVGKRCEEGAFEDEDDDEDEDDLAASAAMGLAQKSARISKSPRVDFSLVGKLAS